MKLLLTAARWVVSLAIMIIAYIGKPVQAVLKYAGDALRYLKPSETFVNAIVALLTDYGESKINSFKSKTKLSAGKSVVNFTEDFEHRNFA